VPGSIRRPSGTFSPPRGRAEPAFTVIPVVDPVLIEEITVAAKQRLGMGENKVRRYLKVLVDKEQVQIHEKPRPRTRPEVRYTKK
jgi:hypothetical protein